MQRLIDLFFAIPAAWALGAVFFLTCAEASVVAFAVGGAILGDFIGYLIGRRFGTAFLQRSFPKRWPPVRAWIDRRGGPAIFLGRSTAFLRAVVPTAAGAARISPWRFLFWNVLGGVTWGTGFSVLGYLVGEEYEAALHWAGRGSRAILVLILTVIAFFVIKRILVKRLASPVPPQT